jgi:dihydroflavonol-4-reductase
MEGAASHDETVLVTGGSGFLGGWCLVQLLQAGYRVRTTVRDPAAREGEVRAMVASEVDAGDRLAVLGADLAADAGWKEAAAGCTYVLHVASPFPPAQPKDPDELIVPARDGTMRVLRASLDAGVRRIVLTSSSVAIRNAGVEPPPRPFTEDDWTDPENPHLTPYGRSKTIAERAAWDFVREGDAARLAVVNPGAILGPVLSPDLSYSLQVVERMLKGMPGLPRLGFNFVDVRDVADLHIRAMTSPQAGGERFVAVTGFLWMTEVAAILRAQLGAAAAKVPTRTVPNLLVRGMALFDPGLRTVVGELGQRVEYSNEKARSQLGWSPRPLEETIADTARSMFEHGVVTPQAA